MGDMLDPFRFHASGRQRVLSAGWVYAAVYFLRLSRIAPRRF
jgi:hypothetical protein